MNSAIIATFLISGKDIRDFGSKNAGLTNVYRCFGKTAAALTLIFDFLKGIIVVFVSRLPFIIGLLSDTEYDVLSVSMVAALLAIIGHSFPIFYGFKGGKGILIAGVCMLATDPIVFVCEVVLFFTLVGITRYISVGSIACCIGYPVFTLIWQVVSVKLFDTDYEMILVHVIIALLIGALCFVRHLPNVKRLINHEENRFTIRKD